MQRLGGHHAARQGVIWCQAPSVGELDALVPLLPALKEQGEVLITTHSCTGLEKAQALSGLTALAPIDTPAATGRFIDNWTPRIAIFVESDMPANMLLALAKRKIPSALVAARASRTRRRFPATAKSVLQHCAVVTASTPAVARELRDLGLSVAAVEDLKSQSAQTVPAPAWAHPMAQRPVWLAASAHTEDWPMIFAAHDRILAARPDAMLIAAPRHTGAGTTWLPDRFTARFHSKQGTPAHDTQVFVMDALGQMPSLHAAGPVTYLGGAMGDLGGHSPWEAAAAGNHIVTGPYVQNNAAAFAQLPHHVVRNASDLAGTVLECFDRPPPAPVTASRGTATRDALLAVLARHPA
jgi:3-deoxy-D-manno-octulosonic-acid transferase